LHVKKYIFGHPIETEAVTLEIEEEKGNCPYVETDAEKKEIHYSLGKDDIVYGLGEQVRGINKRGWLYTSFCNDEPNHREDIHSLYGAHNFLIIDGEQIFGIFLDTPEMVTFDIGYTKADQLKICLSSWNAKCYIIEGASAYEIVKEFRKIIGRSYIPPKWAFGIAQSRWGYRNQQDVEAVAEQYKKNRLPLDIIYMDIDYMEEYMDFTVDHEKFPDFPAFVQKMKEQGIHLVPIIDAGVKIKDNYSVYEEGVKNHYFCKNAKGQDFIGAAWPGRVHFPDMLNDDARRWFGKKYQFLLDQGIDGFWNDMNEPAIFYSDWHLAEVFEKLHGYEGENLDVHSFFEMGSAVKSLSNYQGDYESFYHNYRGAVIRHDKVHNLYGYYMTRSAAEAFDEIRPEERTLLVSRASYIGMHRYSGIWMGDNRSWWSHLLLNIKMLANLNMCGFLYTGADIGGFGSNTTEDLLMRWYAFGIFTPLLRNHSTDGTRLQEPYQFSNVESCRGILQLRYMLLPYLYSEYMKAVLNDDMYAKPLAFVYPQDLRAKRVEDQLIIGESIMIAPVYEQNAKGRYVYLPEDMKLYRMRSPEDMDEEILGQGDHYVRAEENEVLLFVRKNHLVPIASGADCIAKLDMEHLDLLQYVVTDAEYELYDDDGHTKEYTLDGHIRKYTFSAK